MSCEIVQLGCKRAGERKVFPAFELVNVFSRVWIADHPFAAGVRIRPAARQPTGFEYESSGGQSSGREPKRWPTVLGATVVDGSITWTAVAQSYNGLLYRIESVTYTVPAGVTLHEQTIIDAPGAQQVPIEVSGGTADKQYDIVAKVQATTVGASAPLYELVLRLDVE
jgi:hypothetical protein